MGCLAANLELVSTERVVKILFSIFMAHLNLPKRGHERSKVQSCTVELRDSEVYCLLSCK